MTKARKHYEYLILLLAAALLSIVILCGCSSKAGKDSHANLNKCTDLNSSEYTIGVMNGTVNGPIVEETLPKANVSYFNSEVDMLTALQNGKVDAVVGDQLKWHYYNRQLGDKLRVFDDYLKPYIFGFVFNKSNSDKTLINQMNQFIEKIKKDGTYDEINNNWISDDGKAVMTVDTESLPATNGTIKVATTGTSPPFSYIENGQTVGFDIDLVARFCKEYGYGLELVTMSFDGIIPAISSGKCDMGANEIAITEERAESVDFSIEYYEAGTSAAMWIQGSETDKGFFESLKESLYKTFVSEKRYMLFISGIGTTLLITILSAFFGTLLGFWIYMMCRGGNRIANAITNVCVRIIQMLPAVVLLMILFYIVFAKASVSGIFVSVVAFSMTFAASVFGMLKSSISAIDCGQTEAAYALGFGNLRTFFKIVLPQAMVYFLPSYKSELISLIKATAIVGYIAVQDLTRVGDIVRSRTYEAFFPLISVALIYFALAWLLITIAGRFEFKFDPKRRKKEDILKGIKTDD